MDRPRGSTLQKIASVTGREVSDLRPDMDTEERDLRAQLDRIEKRQEEMDEKLDEILERLTDTDEAEGVPDRLPDVDPEQDEAAAS